MWQSVLAAGIGATAQTGSGLINAGLTMYTNKRNRQLVEAQNREDMRRWEMQNYYDNPVSQMERMRKAGLNPALMYGGSGSIAASAPMQAANASRDVAPEIAGLPTMADALSVARAKAEIDNINADTQQKKQETKGKEIQNEVDAMNKDAFKSAYETGLVHSAAQAGFEKLVDDARINKYTLFESAWRFATLVGCSVADSLKSSDFAQSGTYSIDDGSYIPDFNFSEDVFKRANDIFQSSEEAQIEANRAARMIAELQSAQKQKDVNIWNWLNDKAKSDKWYESIPATIGLIGLWIAEQRFQTPAFNFTIDKGDKVFLPKNKD